MLKPPVVVYRMQGWKTTFVRQSRCPALFRRMTLKARQFAINRTAPCGITRRRHLHPSTALPPITKSITKSITPWYHHKVDHALPTSRQCLAGRDRLRDRLVDTSHCLPPLARLTSQEAPPPETFLTIIVMMQAAIDTLNS